MSHDLLLEIGCEELPASFVTQAVETLPELLTGKLAELRLEHGPVRALGTPRRLAVLASSVASHQPDLDEQVLGPPARVAFDASGQPTKACLAFTTKLGCSVNDLVRVDTPKGEYLAGRRQERGIESLELLPRALAQLCGGIPFRKSMRWSDGDTAFGRPVRWIVALYGEAPIDFVFAGVRAGRVSCGHRFLSSEPVSLARPSEYVDVLRARHVLVDTEERKQIMLERLRAAARQAGGALIEDGFLVDENASLVEEPQVVVGGFEPEFLSLPEQVILVVAKGHQRYFGVRGQRGELLPKYLAVCNTAVHPDNVRRGNDRVMRARLADAKFFFGEDRKQPLGMRRPALDGIVFHKRLGTVGDKVRRMERLVESLGSQLGLPGSVVECARRGVAIAKCDLATLMVGELPELQGEMGRAYALAAGEDPAVADVIHDHYQPRGADDPIASSAAGALGAIVDRIDTLTGCFAVGLMPTGTADPLALRRAAIGLLRTVLGHGWDLSISRAVADAYPGFAGMKLDLGVEDTQAKLAEFLAGRLRGLLASELPQDAVDACLASGADRPLDVVRRARALGEIDPSVRALAGEVFKRAANIAKDALEGPPVPPAEVQVNVHPSEVELFRAFGELDRALEAAQTSGEYARALGAVAGFAPIMAQYYKDVFVMVDDERIRNNRLRLMRQIHQRCSTLAHFNLLAAK